jgi:hypothetical protein
MKPIKSNRIGVFCFSLVIGGLFYLTDCLVARKSHPDVLWLESGVHNPSPVGFGLTVIIVLVGLGYLIFGKD